MHPGMHTSLGKKSVIMCWLYKVGFGSLCADVGRTTDIRALLSQWEVQLTISMQLPLACCCEDLGKVKSTLKFGFRDCTRVDINWSLCRVHLVKDVLTLGFFEGLISSVYEWIQLQENLHSLLVIIESRQVCKRSAKVLSASPKNKVTTDCMHSCYSTPVHNSL